MNKQPEQTSATRQKLMDGFWDIYLKKEIEKITISEITRTAGYNRGTFYEYFTDIYDLLNQLEDELLDQIQHQIKLTFKDGLPKDIETYSLKCTSIFKQFDDSLFALLGEFGDPKFGNKLRNTFFSVFTNISHMPPQVENIDYIITFAYSSLVGMMTHWYEKGKDLSDEEFVKMLQSLVASGVMGYSNISLFTQ